MVSLNYRQYCLYRFQPSPPPCSLSTQSINLEPAQLDNSGELWLKNVFPTLYYLLYATKHKMLGRMYGKNEISTDCKSRMAVALFF